MLCGKPRKMKKSTRSKSKKVTRRHDTSYDDSKSSQSISSPSNDSRSLYSDSDSMRSVSFSSSSSEATYRGRKKMSRARSNLKSTRKRIRRRSSSSEDFSHKNKRKRSRKNADSKSSKKSRKKKARRDMSSSSTTSDSYSCSTCKEESDSFSEESEVKQLRIKSRENEKHKRESREERVRTKKRTRRSPCCSSYSRSRDQSYSVSQGEENFIGESKSRRLRSVITVAKHEKEGNKSEKDSLKEEIIYDHDDYPSPRSNDSSGGGSKRDLTSHSHVTSGYKRQEENVKGEETFVTNHTMTEPPECSKNDDEGNFHDPFLDEVETNNYKKESRTFGSLPDANIGGDDLEAILRQKALENLRKFRGGSQRNVKSAANQKNKDDGDVNKSFSSKAEIIQRVLPQQDGSNVIGHVQTLDSSNKSTFKGEVSCPNEADGDITDGGNAGIQSGIAKQKAIHPPDELALSGNSLKEDHMTTQAVAVKCESGISLLGEKGSATNSSLNQAVISQELPGKILTEIAESKRKIAPRKTDSVTPSVNNNTEAGVSNASSSATVELASSEPSTSRGQEQQTEAKDGSQFEQKTMSVMRGGEMVQVSYKVYIPKRAPALERRQLKR